MPLRQVYAIQSFVSMQLICDLNEATCTCFFRSGLVESKIRILIRNLEHNEFINLAHIYPHSYGRLNERYIERELFSFVGSALLNQRYEN